MDFDVDFVMELFLDDSYTTINRLVVAAANVINEDSENVTKMNEVFRAVNQRLIAVPVPKRSRQYKFKTKKREAGYYENVLLKYSNKDYIERFIMKKSTVQALITFLKDVTDCEASITPLDKKVHIFLWLLTSNASFNEVALLFGLNKSSVGYIFHDMAKLLSEQQHRFITWPSLEEQNIIRTKVQSLHKFPNCVGFIDACCFKVGSKCSKKTHPDPIMLQAVCDESFSFINIHIGSIGNTRKSKVFKESNLGQDLKKIIDFNNHILGGSDYKLRKNLITPYTSEQLLTGEEIIFNEVHSKSSAYIGHAFEKLMCRFKRLNHLDISRQGAVNSVIIAACVLHNFIILQEECTKVKQEDEIVASITLDSDIVKTAVDKRQFLCNYINYYFS